MINWGIGMLDTRWKFVYRCINVMEKKDLGISEQKTNHQIFSYRAMHPMLVLRRGVDNESVVNVFVCITSAELWLECVSWTVCRFKWRIYSPHRERKRLFL